MKKHFHSFEQFWKLYMEEHSLPLTQRLHAYGTLLACLWAVGCFWDKRPLHLPLAFVIGYGFAWYAHAFVQKNKPVTFSHPIWSLAADFRLAYLYFRKKLPRKAV